MSINFQTQRPPAPAYATAGLLSGSPGEADHREGNVVKIDIQLSCQSSWFFFSSTCVVCFISSFSALSSRCDCYCVRVVPVVVSRRLPPPCSRFLKKSVTSACLRYCCGFSGSFSEREAVVAVDCDWLMYFSKNFESSSTTISSLAARLPGGKGITSL